MMEFPVGVYSYIPSISKLTYFKKYNVHPTATIGKFTTILWTTQMAKTPYSACAQK